MSVNWSEIFLKRSTWVNFGGPSMMWSNRGFCLTSGKLWNRYVTKILTKNKSASWKVTSVLKGWIVSSFPVTKNILTECTLYSVIGTSVEEPTSCKIFGRHCCMVGPSGVGHQLNFFVSHALEGLWTIAVKHLGLPHPSIHGHLDNLTATLVLVL